MFSSSGCSLCDFETDDHTWYHASDCPIGKSLRDSWTTPDWLTSLLGRFSLDPCSNERSAVSADRHVCLPEDGLAISWKDHDVFLNGPYSDLLPWAVKCAEARSVIALVNHDHSTEWYRAFGRSGLHWEFKFNKRIKFIPPPHIRQSSNSKPQSLLCTWNAAVRIDKALMELDLGSWWTVRSPSVDT